MGSASRAQSKDVSTLTIDGHEVTLTRLSKVLYPEAHVTKAEVISYYVRVAPFILPHLRNRPVTLKRYPNGVKGEAYWDKDAPSFTPAWVERFPVPRRAGGPDIHYILIHNRATLAWTANIAALELHPFLHCKPEIERPTSVVFDLDPGPGADIFQCIKVGRLLRALFAGLHLECFAKVSGSKGLQIYVPLNSNASYGETQAFARAVAGMIEQQRPELATSVMAKAQRAGKVFIDWSQNSDFKTTVGVYSLRAKSDRPLVSMPVSWEELESAFKRQSAGDLAFEPAAALDRLERVGDLFAPVLHLCQTLPAEVGDAISQRKPRRVSRSSNVLPRRSAQGGRRRFLLKKQGAGYELWLEIDGMLKSWLLPQGLPTKPGVKRPATPAAYHSLDDLSSTAGWDVGTYEIIEGSYSRAQLEFGLRGKKIAGEFRLYKEGRSGWILEQAGGAHVDFVEPMQCKLESRVPEGSVWQYEAKLDGYRAVVKKQSGEVAVLSRRNHSLTSDFPDIAAAFEPLPDGTLIDGEIVALDAAGKPSFNLLQNRRLNRKGVRFYAFDLLVLGGKSLIGEPLRRRRELLARTLSGIKHPVYMSVALKGTPADLLETARRHNLEGIVAKRLDRRYEPGKRSGAWVKVKVALDQELIIGGYLPAAKRHFDALLVGYYEGSKLIFAGKIRNGFKSPGSKERVFARFKGLGTDRCPFDNLPEPGNARRGMALTSEAMQLCCWLEPKLVAQVGIREWTADGHLRHSTFLGLREDKNPREVVREEAA